MAQRAPAPFRLTKDQTASVMHALEERKYGRRLNAEQLAQKANVDLDSVNRVELHLPIHDAAIRERIANALGITTDLLAKVAGLSEIRPEEWQTLQSCLQIGSIGQPEGDCGENIGLRPIQR